MAPEPCDLGELPVVVDCYRLSVPEDRTRPAGRTVGLFVALLRSPSPRPEADPVLYLEGGPGISASLFAADWAASPLLAHRDVILLDQRGTGRSTPRLDCPELDSALLSAFTETGRTAAEELAETRSAAGRCAGRLRAEGVDLDAYDSVATAADVADLRATLGVAEWNVYGISYGTRAAQAVMRYAPEGVRSVVLDSGASPVEGETPSGLAGDFETGLANFLASCEAHPACGSDFPSLERTFQEMTDRYDAEPHRVRAAMPTREGEREVTVEITGHDLAALVTNALKQPDFVAAAPAFVTAVATGDTAPLDQLVVPLLASVLEPGVTQLGTQLSVDCADWGRMIGERDRALLNDPGRWSTVMLFTSGAYCDVWGVAAAPASYNEPVRSDIPTLLLAGRFDPISLPSQTRVMGDDLSRATYVEIADGGHGVSQTSPCAWSITDAFVAEPSSEPDTSCATAAEGASPFDAAEEPGTSAEDAAGM